MAYISKEKAAAIRAEIKKRFPEWKFSIRVDNHSQLCVNIMAGPANFNEILGDRGYAQLNPYLKYEEDVAHCYSDDQFKFEPYAAFFNEIISIMKRGGDWYDNSDAMTDYFDTAYYLSLGIGNWDKPYIQK